MYAHLDDTMPNGSKSLISAFAELRDFEPDDQQEIEVDEGNTAVIECHLPESQPKAQVRYSVKQEWLETSKGSDLLPRQMCLSASAFLSNPMPFFCNLLEYQNPAMCPDKGPRLGLYLKCGNMGKQLFIFQPIYFEVAWKRRKAPVICGWYADDAWGL